MIVAVIIIFVIGNLLIAIEHPIKVNKSAMAITTGALAWAVYFLVDPNSVEQIEVYPQVSAINKLPAILSKSKNIHI